MVDDDDQLVPRQHPVPAMNAAEFETFVASMFEQTRPLVEDLRVTLQEQIPAADGRYIFDATIRFRLGGMDFLVLVEAKHHTHRIKRDVIQTLHSKMASVGAHKGVVVSTAHFQRGALRYASSHGIALVHVTEGRFTLATRGAEPLEPPSPAVAAAFRLSPFVAHCYTAGEHGMGITVVSDYPECAATLLLGVSNSSG